MSEKIKLFKTEVFFEREHVDKFGRKVMQMTMYLPIDAIYYAIESEPGNPHRGYHIHFKKNYLPDLPVKSINPVLVQEEKIEVIK